MKSQSTLASTSVKNEVYDTYKIPTFGTKQMDQEVELSVETLNDPAAANALRIADPFTYYSCFTPSNTLSSKLADLVPGSKQSEEESNQTKTIKVTRKGCVSVESDGLEFLLNDFQGTSDVQEYCDEYDAFVSGLYSKLGVNIENDMQEEEEFFEYNIFQKQ
jgi:hypothetical protein